MEELLSYLSGDRRRLRLRRQTPCRRRCRRHRLLRPPAGCRNQERRRVRVGEPHPSYSSSWTFRRPYRSAWLGDAPS